MFRITKLTNIDYWRIIQIEYFAPVAQWIEHLTSDQGVGGSSPLWCANYKDC